ncbi:hypothetical protein SPIROBIBN47_180002 [uncultured spirochete]|uniref:Glycosyltransferase 2-like domain-containing protein n=1 Tax=uncultured spirochete TaxID=156406 RepID=A0A3P3XGG5_9SPIR|nr:hypothetical protein SPIROBIBN47_180002 [uncultured spirochete]
MSYENLLEILIPTYNRKRYLEKNLKILSNIIRNINAQNEISILISDNSSSDGTKEMLEIFKINNSDIKINIYIQKENIGLKNNSLFVLKKAIAKYVMYLGDDDYISEEYLLKIKNIISNTNCVTCIVPSNIAIDLQGNIIPKRGRDFKKSTKIYKKGYLTASQFMWRGHQLSGIVFKRKDTLGNYYKNCEDNIYLFMYFVGFNAIRGDLIHLTEYPVKVTAAPQELKDWNYGKDGLVSERFKNSYCLFKNKLIYKFIAEYYLTMNNNRGFLYKILKNDIFSFMIYFSNYLKCKYVSIIGKIFFIMLTIYDSCRIILNKIIKEVIKRK